MAWVTYQPKDNFNCKLWTGTGAEQTITGIGFEPGVSWLKRRETKDHVMSDAVRGATKIVYPNDTSLQDTNSEFIKSFNADGFVLGTSLFVNANGGTYVGWSWKTATTSGISGGTITPSSYSINATTGVGIYAYTGTGSAGTIAHGLGEAPKLVIVKRLDSSAQWSVYHKSVGAAKHLIWDTSAAEVTSSNYWNDTDPTSSVFSIGSGTDVNASGGTYIAYAFVEKPGFSKIGKYVGNNDSDGPFIFTGFKPGLLIQKAISGTDQWQIRDKKRGFNGAIKTLYCDSNEAETSGDTIDLLSNGFRMYNNSSAQNSAAGYAFWAFAEEPLVATNGDPATGG